MVRENWDISSIYSSVFDVAAIFTAFLFTFYSLVVTTERGFIGRAKGTRPYNQMVRYTLLAVGLGAALTFVSIFMMVAKPIPIDHNDVALYLVAAWFGWAVWVFAAFARAARLFSIFVMKHH